MVAVLLKLICTDGQLLDLGFFVINMLADRRIILLDGDLFRGVPLVFLGRVEMTGAC